MAGLEIGDTSGEPFLDAFYLSIETMTTIGYGVPDQYFNGCIGGLFVISTQALLGFLFSAWLFGMIFYRIARAHSRGNWLKFADSCVVRVVNGRLLLMFQVVDTATHACQYIRVKLWTVLHDPDDEKQAQVMLMRMLQPDDYLGINELILATPSLVVHEIDPWSPLCPKPVYNRAGANSDTDGGGGTGNAGSGGGGGSGSASGSGAGGGGSSAYSSIASVTRPDVEYTWPSPCQRLLDSEVALRSAWPCNICGNSFGSAEKRQHHYAVAIANDGAPRVEKTCVHCGTSFATWGELGNHTAASHPDTAPITEDELQQARPELFFNHSFFYDEGGNPHTHPAFKEQVRLAPPPTMPDVKEWMLTSQPEIIIHISAIDSVTGCDFEAVKSYTMDDVQWDHAFKPATSRKVQAHAKGGGGKGGGGDEDSWNITHGKVTVDFTAFNETVPCDPLGSAPRVC